MLDRDAEFERRVKERLAKWHDNYAAKGVQSASPLMDQITAEEEVMAEMRAEGHWPTRTRYRGEEEDAGE